MDLAVLWFWIVAFLFVGYFVLDGFDFGVGMSLPFLGKDDTDRRVLINTIGPVWDLNETWVIVAGACAVRGVPRVVRHAVQRVLPRAAADPARAHRCAASRSSTATSGPSRAGRSGSTRMIVVGSAVPALLWGVAFANIVQGVPLDADHNYTGTLFDLLNPYALLGGAHHAAALLHARRGVRLAEDRRARCASGPAGSPRRRGLRHDRRRRGVPHLDGLASGTLPGSGCSPRSRRSALIGGWLANAARARGLRRSRCWRSRSPRPCSRLFAALFPDVMPASNDPANSLTIANASSTDVHAHGHELGRRSIFLPLVLALPGLDVLGVPQAGDARASIEAAAH